MIETLLRCGRVTRHLPYVRGLGALRKVYERTLPRRDMLLKVNDFDGDLVMEVDVREIIGINLWHRPAFFEKNERALFCGAITPGCTVLDVGANIGIYTLLAAKRGARVFAIEADPRNVERLERHLQLNGLAAQVTIFPIAVGDSDGSISLFRAPGNSGHSNVFEGIDPVEVPLKTIDSLNLPPIDVCKMDIEGNELRALAGMQATIDRSPGMKMLVEYAEALGRTDGMLPFLCSRFAPVYAIRYPPFSPVGPLTASQKPPAFCNLWARRG
jgi:FkbM family methyltransferase